MNKDALLEEMLQEVKNLKDLTKEELPLIAKEYIHANLIGSLFVMGVSGVMLVISLVCGLYSMFGTFHENSGPEVLSVVVAICGSVVGFILMGIGTTSYIDFKLQPRRMAIKAITSLIKE